MAVRVFQLSIVFTIGVLLSSATFPVISLTSNLVNNRTLFLKDPEDVIVARGRSATFKCEAQSSTNGLNYTWYFNDDSISLNDSRRKILNDGSLFIPKVTGKGSSSLEGSYRCLVSNKKGSILSLAAKLQIATIEYSTEQIKDNNFREQQPIVLPCLIHSIPNAIYSWEKDNLPLPNIERYIPLPSGTLIILNSKMSDTGSYKCRATNELLKKTKAKEVKRLSVISLSDNQAPIISQIGSTHLTVRKGESLTLYCIVSGWPIPSIRWTFNRSTYIGNSSILALENVNFTDSGMYSCTAKNSAGTNSMEYQVDVQQLPYFNVTPTSLTYPLAKIVRLKCHALGYPEPKITWLKNGLPLPSEPRIKIDKTELILSTSYTYDAGIYQCIATNSAGSVWSSAELTPTKDKSPSPPENVRCEPYNETSICLQWTAPLNIQPFAYTLHWHEESNLDENPRVTNLSYYLATGLKKSTNYRFYVRHYSNDGPSDNTVPILCKAGKKGSRNLKVQKVDETSVEVSWSKMSDDFPCGYNSIAYRIEWRRVNQTSINANIINDYKEILTDIKPQLIYEYRVNESDWVKYVLEYDTENPLKNETLFKKKIDDADTVPLAPYQLAASTTSTSINLTWNDSNHFEKYYTVCYYESNNETKCNDHYTQQSLTNHMEIDKLKPNTYYTFKVKTHKIDNNFGPWSYELKEKTKPGVPSQVLDVTYKIINESTVCVRWRPPLSKNGRLLNYIIRYTVNINRPVNEWYLINIAINKTYKPCWGPNQHFMSTLLSDLNPTDQYRLIITAKTEAGEGSHTALISFSTKDWGLAEDYEEGEFEPEKSKPTAEENISSKQKLGIIVGSVLATGCLFLCISCMVYYQLLIKRRAALRSAASSNNYPHNINPGLQTNVRHPHECTAEAHEMQHLVEDDTPTTNVHSDGSAHLDTKGAERTPTSHMNGLLKYKNSNGFIANGHVHITENPQYLASDYNGISDLKKCYKISPETYDEPITEDTNSNLQNTQFHDLQKLYEVSRLKVNDSPSCIRREYISPIKNSPKTNYHDMNNSLDSLDIFNSTQVTILDDPLILYKRPISTALGPNG